jgi:chemotaxis protein MotB
VKGLTSSGLADPVNPYIALADSTLNLVLILVLFVATLLFALLQKEDTHKSGQDTFVRATDALPEAVRPVHVEFRVRNDPPGTQRFLFSNHLLFTPGTATLTPDGRKVLNAFIGVLATHGNVWRRVRIEGHTTRTPQGQNDNWVLATNRAATVAQLLTSGHCKINPEFIATAGRGGQTKLDQYGDADPHQERVEIILEYADQTAVEKKCL